MFPLLVHLCVLWLKSKPRLYCTPGTSWYLKEIAQRIKAIMSPYWRNWIVPRQFFDILNWAFQKHFCIEVWIVLNLEKLKLYLFMTNGSKVLFYMSLPFLLERTLVLPIDKKCLSGIKRSIFFSKDCTYSLCRTTT